MATARTRRGALVGALAVVTLVVVLIASGGVVSGLRTIGRGVVAPFAWTLNEVAKPIADLVSGAVNYSNVVHQNDELRYELSQIRVQNDEDESLKRQLAALTATLHVPFVGSLTTVSAQVTDNSPTNFSATFSIDKGRLDGILAGMPVVGNGGVLGRVLTTTSHGATVELITDPASIVGCTFGEGHNDILVSGRGVNSPLAANEVPLSVAISPGTLLTTDGLAGGIFPPGLPVATVTTVSATPGSSTYNLTLRPVANLRELSYVDVVLWEPAT